MRIADSLNFKARGRQARTSVSLPRNLRHICENVGGKILIDRLQVPNQLSGTALSHSELEEIREAVEFISTCVHISGTMSATRGSSLNRQLGIRTNVFSTMALQI